jgi:ketosteroid isomerase-like protein
MGDEVQHQPETLGQAIGKLNAMVTEAFNRGDVKACVASYAEDAILVVADRPPIKGRDAIESFLREYAISGVKLAPV